MCILSIAMEQFEQILGGLTRKVHELADRQRKLVVENQRLLQANSALTQELDVEKKANLRLTEQNKVVKIARSETRSGEDRKEERKRLNELVRDIDKCIALLNN